MPRALVSLVLLIMGAVFIYLFDTGLEYPIWIPLFALLMGSVVLFVMPVRYGYFILPKLQLIFLATPFLPLYGYVILSEFNWGWTPEMLIAINPITNLKLATLGAIGSLGFATGIQIASRSNKFLTNHFRTPLRKGHYSKYAFVFGIIFSVTLSYMSAPTSTIFGGAYGGESLNTIATYINFPGAYLVSYALIIALYIDAEDDVGDIGIWKRRVIVLTIAYIAIFLQFLRGDREILGLFFALTALYLTRTHRLGGDGLSIPSNMLLKSEFSKKSRTVLLWGLGGLFFLLALGSLRFTVSEGIFGVNDIFFANPWTMALLTMLAFLHARLDESLLWGQTYIEYILSIPPGFIASTFGFRRAIEMDNNIAVILVESGISSGGSHIFIPSLQNFGAIGVFIFMAIYSYSSAVVERNAIRGHYLSKLLWLNLIAVVPLWFWYGEMSAVRAVMAAVFVYYISRLKVLKR